MHMTTRRRSGALRGLTAGALLLLGGVTPVPPLAAQGEQPRAASENEQSPGDRITLQLQDGPSWTTDVEMETI